MHVPFLHHQLTIFEMHFEEDYIHEQDVQLMGQILVRYEIATLRRRIEIRRALVAQSRVRESQRTKNK